MIKLVSEEISHYCEAHSTLPSKVAQDLETYTLENVPMAMMLTGPLVGSFLGQLIKLSKAKKVLEIGTYTGYSALVMAESLPNDGEVVTLDVNPETNDIAKNYWKKSPHGKKIRPILGPALETLEKLDSEFDFVFIDADKGNYLNYLKKSLLLLKDDGLIVADNCLWSGRVLEKNGDEATQSIKEFNDWVKNNSALEGTLVPLRDGLFLIRKA